MTNQFTIPTGEWTTESEAETRRLGAEVGRRLKGGEVLLLNGTLGAGKTIFVKGIMDALDFGAEEVTSPTFTLINRYDARIPVYHLDLYRLNSGFTAADAVDLDELLMNEIAVIIIEWAERLENYPLPESALWRIAIQGEGEDRRRISITAG